MGGISARELEQLVQRDLADGAPRPAAAPRPDKPLKPDVQRDLDALLGSILADLEPRPKPD